MGALNVSTEDKTLEIDTVSQNGLDIIKNYEIQFKFWKNWFLGS